MPLEFDKKKEVMRTQVKLRVPPGWERIFCDSIILEQFSYCTWSVCLLLSLRKGKKHLIFEAVCLYHLSVNVNKKKVTRGSISNLSPKRTVFYQLKSQLCVYSYCSHVLLYWFRSCVATAKTSYPKSSSARSSFLNGISSDRALLSWIEPSFFDISSRLHQKEMEREKCKTLVRYNRNKAIAKVIVK